MRQRGEHSGYSMLLPDGFVSEKKEAMEHKIVKIKDKEFKPYIEAKDIDRIICQLAERLNRDYAGKKPLLVAILNGAFIFAADLVKKLDFPCRISLIKVSSYSGVESTHNVCELIGLQESIKDEDVIIVEDIVDTGVTMEHLLARMKKEQPKSLAICSLLFKPDKFTKDYKIDYIGKSIPNQFVVGYGFDYDGFGRNLPDIYQLNE